MRWDGRLLLIGVDRYGVEVVGEIKKLVALLLIHVCPQDVREKDNRVEQRQFLRHKQEAV